MSLETTRATQQQPSQSHMLIIELEQGGRRRDIEDPSIPSMTLQA